MPTKKKPNTQTKQKKNQTKTQLSFLFPEH